MERLWLKNDAFVYWRNQWTPSHFKFHVFISHAMQKTLPSSALSLGLTLALQDDIWTEISYYFYHSVFYTTACFLYKTHLHCRCGVFSIFLHTQQLNTSAFRVEISYNSLFLWIFSEIPTYTYVPKNIIASWHTKWWLLAFERSRNSPSVTECNHITPEMME